MYLNFVYKYRNFLYTLNNILSCILVFKSIITNNIGIVPVGVFIFVFNLYIFKLINMKLS